MSVVRIDFEDLHAGDSVENAYDGVTITTTSKYNPAMVFDTDNPTGGDHDLATDNLGNVLIISEDRDAHDPDDNAGGGTFVFDFDTPVDDICFDVLDIEESSGNYVTLFDAHGDVIATKPLPVTGNNGQATLNLTGFEDVARMEITFKGSGAIDNIVYLQESTPAPDGIVSGTAGDDIIDTEYTGDPDGDMIDNEDAIIAGEAPNDDIVEAGAGDDTVHAGEGDDDVYGGTGNDTIDGGKGDDRLYGEAGDDTISGGEGADRIIGGDGSDTVHGGYGNDYIDTRGNRDPDFGISGTPDVGYPDFYPADDDPHDDRDTVTGGSGDDTIYTGDDNDVIDGGDGNDRIFAGFDDDTVTGGDGHDFIEGSEGNDTIDGGKGNDTIYGGSSDPRLDPLNIADEDGDLRPDNNGDTIYGGEGKDTIYGQDDDDLIYGGQGDDYIDGGVDNDTIDGGNGDDTLIGGQGDDTIYGGGGEDTIYGGDGNDTIDGGSKDDVIDGGAGDDVIDGGKYDDTIEGGSGDDTLNGGSGHDIITDSSGSDTVSGGNGNDTIDVGRSDGGAPDVDYPGLYAGDDDPTDDRDTVDGGEGDDTISTGDDDDVISGGDGKDTIYAGFDDDTVDGGADDDLIRAGEGNDTVDGGSGNDVIYGDSGDPLTDPAMLPNDGTDERPDNNSDTLSGGAGNDTIYGEDDDDVIDGGSGDDYLDGGLDDDTITGGEGKDTLIGGSGDDVLDGGADNDLLEGGDGNDTLTGGGGKDQLFGGFGDDLFIGGNYGDVVVGGEDEDGQDIDVLDLRGTGVDNIEYVDGDPEAGTVTFTDGKTMTFSEIENVIPCFTPGTRIATPKGERAVEDLRPGDRVITRDNGIQEIAWTGAKAMTGRQLMANSHLKPVLIRAGALGGGLPERDMLVSPNHRCLVSGDRTALYFEENEVLVAAKHLVGGAGVHEVDVMGLSYIHFMFERHEVVLSNGAWTESFQPGDYSLKGIGNAQRTEIFELFPELRTQKGLGSYASARRSLKKHEARLLAR